MNADAAHADALLEAVRRQAGTAVAYAEPPARMTGGRDTLVFALRLRGASGDLARPLVARVFRPGEGRRATFEMAVHRLLHDKGLPVPRVLLDGVVQGRPFVLMERVPGRVAGEHIVPPSPTVLRIPRLMAEAAVALHAVDAAPVAAALEPLATRALRPLEEMHRRVARLEEAGDGRFGLIATWLDANAPPSGNEVLCHGDFHPLNVLIEGGAVSGVIDWPNLQVAPAEYDLARSLLTLREAPMSLPLLVRPLAWVVRRQVGRSYLSHYRRLRPVDAGTFDYWLAFAGTAMLVEGALAVQEGRTTHPWSNPADAARLCRCVERAGGLGLSMLGGAA